MKLDKLVGERFKERPSECSIDSHALMQRGAYMKYVSNGIYSQYPPLRRVCKKIEAIIREEMDAIDGQEVLFPVVMPASLWMESGRYDSIGQELLRFEDRNGTPMVLGMTHEEASVQLVREYGSSYTRYPFMIYQIQTKYRDEARPRGGMIRVREFTMKDGYSFHTSEEDLNEYYKRCHGAYERIFARAGIPEVVSVKSDSGMMGGSVSHEFMLLTPIGEDTIAICNECGFRSNMEAAESITECADFGDAELCEVATPGKKTIEEVAEFLGAEAKQTCKAVVYAKNSDCSPVVIFLRGDLDVNETKLRNLLGCEIHPATEEECEKLAVGFIGPVGLPSDITVLYDNSIKGCKDLIAGGNKTDVHVKGFTAERDIPGASFNDLAKIANGGICPVCGKHTVELHRGIEVGNIFCLGTKYTKAMGMQYADADGELKYPIMGCYGIGVGRLAASVCEAHHDDYGPIWPKAIAPWQVHLCCVRADDAEAKKIADGLYGSLLAAGVEVIYDDRNVSAGVMFSDADLIGAPLRVIVSPRNLKENAIELASRDKSFKEKVAVDEALSRIIELAK